MNFTFWTYAWGDSSYLTSRTRLENMIRAQGITDIRQFSPDDLAPDFKERHIANWENPRAPIRNGKPYPIYDGCVIWRPYIMLKLLQEAEWGDIILHMDTSDIITGPPTLKQYLIDKTEANKGFAVIKIPNPNYAWTRRDTFILMGCDSQEYWNSPQVDGGFLGVKKTEAVMEFMGTWLTYIADPRCSASLLPNQFGDNLPGFIDHRCDQSIYSLLLKKWNIDGDWQNAGPQRYGLNHIIDYSRDGTGNNL